jgi:hypothetical protein
MGFARNADGIALILIAESIKQVIKSVIHLGNPGSSRCAGWSTPTTGRSYCVMGNLNPDWRRKKSREKAQNQFWFDDPTAFLTDRLAIGKFHAAPVASGVAGGAPKLKISATI